MDSGPWRSCESPYTADALADGPHTFAVRATDAAGNTDPSPASVAFAVESRCSLLSVRLRLLGGNAIRVCVLPVYA